VLQDLRAQGIIIHGTLALVVLHEEIGSLLDQELSGIQVMVA
jgi:hypothetical protein